MALLKLLTWDSENFKSTFYGNCAYKHDTWFTDVRDVVPRDLSYSSLRSGK